MIRYYLCPMAQDAEGTYVPNIAQHNTAATPINFTVTFSTPGGVVKRSWALVLAEGLDMSGVEADNRCDPLFDKLGDLHPSFAAYDAWLRSTTLGSLTNSQKNNILNRISGPKYQINISALTDSSTLMDVVNTVINEHDPRLKK